MDAGLLWDAAGIADAYRQATGGAGQSNRIVCPIHGDDESEDNCTIFEMEETGAIWADCHSNGCDPQEVLAAVYGALGVDSGCLLYTSPSPRDS